MRYDENKFIDIDLLENKMNEQDDFQETQIFCSSINIPEISQSDLLSIKNSENPVFVAMGNEMNMILSRVIDRMPAREAEVLAMTLYGGNPTLSQMAKHFKVSISRMYQLKKQTIKDLRKHKGLKNYLLAS